MPSLPLLLSILWGYCNPARRRIPTRQHNFASALTLSFCGRQLLWRENRRDRFGCLSVGGVCAADSGRNRRS
jgi:hypothetical protein